MNNLTVLFTFTEQEKKKKKKPENIHISEAATKKNVDFLF